MSPLQTGKQLEAGLGLFAAYCVQTVLGVMWIGKDKLTTQISAKALADLQEVNILKSKLLSWISRELRTDLVCLNGVLEQLQAETVNSYQSELVQNAAGFANSISGLVGNLLDFSLLEMRRLILKHDLFNISNGMQFLKSTFAKIPNKDIDIQCVIDETLFDGTRFVWGDWGRFCQAITNVVLSALKIAPGGSRIVVLLREVIDEGRARSDSVKLEIEVSVNHLRIPHPDTHYIFEPFFQPSGVAGVGPNLFISKAILEGMNAHISCTSNGQTIFRIRDVKFQTASKDELTRELDRKANSYWSIGDAENVHILLAEDNSLNQAIFKKLIESCHFKLTVVNNGKECVQAWEKAPDKYSMILMDLQMPVMDGWHASMAIRAMEKRMKAVSQIPIVALTATTASTDLDRAVQCGMNECLVKPIRKYELEECTWRVLNSSKWATEQICAQKVANKTD
jgi:CheY-like chemotaxis protein